MNTRVIVGILTVFAIVLGIIVFVNLAGDNIASFFSPLFAQKTTITIDKQQFSATVVKSEKDKQIGLSNRKSLADNEGMYFVFNKADFYGFWMKNMKFPIDIIYINNKHIVTIFQNVQNPKNPTEQLTVYTPTQAADGVLEVKAGIAEKYHFQVGDSILINL